MMLLQRDNLPGKNNFSFFIIIFYILYLFFKNMADDILLSVNDCAEQIFMIIDKDKRRREIAVTTIKNNPPGRRIIHYAGEVNITPYVLGVRVFNNSLDGEMQDPMVPRPFDFWDVEKRVRNRVESLLEAKTEINTLSDLSYFFTCLGEIAIKQQYLKE